MVSCPEATYSLLAGGEGNTSNTTGGGGQPNAGGGPPGGGNDGSQAAAAGGGLPHSNTDNSLNSTASFSPEDLKRTSDLETQNFKNILHDKSLSLEERNAKLMEQYVAKQRE
jgi:hypothetical protein